jgi:hypothetical protein
MLIDEAIRLVTRQEPSHDDIHELISPLRQRMMDDMRMRRLAPTTQSN